MNMEFVKGIIRSVSFHLGKIIVYVLLGVLLTFAVRSRNVNALTITNNYDTINDSYLKVLINTYNTSNYKYYYIASNYESYSTYNRNNYYLCLTNEVTSQSTNNASLNCSEMYSYSYNNGYTLSRYNDNTLNIVDSIYYTNYYDVKDITFKDGLKVAIVIGIWVFALYYILSSFRPTGRGFKYEDI